MSPIFLTLALAVYDPPKWDEWAQERDVAKFIAASSETVRARLGNFEFLKTGGVGGTGKSGWRADEMQLPDGRNVVVLWPKNMGCEDIGQQVFATDGTTLQSLIDERTPQPWRVRHHVFELSFTPKDRRAMITDRVTLEKTKEGSGPLILRIGTNYKVHWIKDGHGSALAFAQAGGVVALHAPPGKKIGLTMHYEGVINDRGNSGIVGPTEATLTGGVWWPSTYREPATYDITVRAPKGWTTIAQGEEVKSTSTDREAISTYSMQLPTSVFSVSSGIFKVYSKVIDGRNFQVLASPDQAADEFDLQNDLNADVIRYFDRIYPYPFKTWTSLVSNVYSDWALEGYSYASYPPDWLAATEPHEISHTWWGGVLCNSYLNSMWNEGFATISERLFLREGTAMPRDEARLAFRTLMPISRSYEQLSVAEASAERSPAVYSVGYDKGGSVLAMLEDELGPVSFEQCLRTFCASRKPGELTEWADFEAAVAKATKKDYGWFFRQWIHGKGSMTLSASEAKITDGTLTANLRSTPAYPRYRLECMISYADGSSDLKVLTITKPEQNITVPVAKRVRMVKFDPYLRLLRNVDFDERPRSLNHPSMRARLSAAEAFLRQDASQQKPEIREGVRGGRLVLGYDPHDPTFAQIAQAAGATVLGTQVTWRGTDVDLTRGAILAVVELGGQWILWAAGTQKVPCEPSDGWLLITDDLGRPKRAATLPSTAGKLSFTW